MKRILVCEDEDAIRDFVVINLVRSGYDVVDVSCGEDAVKVYTEQNGNFDVALLDIMMPGMDGFALCRWIREQSSEIGIIMLSAKSQDYQSRTVQKNGEPIELTQVEYHIMEYLLKNRGTALDRKTILHHIWGEAYYGDDKVVDVNIRRLRMKIEDDPSDPQYIQTIWGFGYKWNG